MENTEKNEALTALRKEIARDLTDSEWHLFLAVCESKKLDPFSRQILPVRVGGKTQYLTTIDGYRLIAARSGEYEGQTGPYWCGSDGEWRDVWLDSKPPTACKIGVMRRGFREPLHAVARFSGYAMTDRNGNPVNLWRKMPDLMLAKCCEALALRKAFPNELSGLYTREEMDQAADNPSVAMEAAVERVREEFPESKIVPDGFPELPQSMPWRKEIVEHAIKRGWDQAETIRQMRLTKAKLGCAKNTKENIEKILITLEADYLESLTEKMDGVINELEAEK